MDIQDPNWNYPVYFEPTFDEIVQLAQSNWDTIRICVTESGNLALGSGYGNTHSSMIQRLKVHLNQKYVWCECYILYYAQSNHQALMNFVDITGNEAVEYREWKKHFNSEQLETLKDLIRESNLIL